MATKRPTPSPGEGKPLAPSPRGATRTAAQAHGEALPIFAFDLETTGLDPHKGARIFAWAICTMDGKTTVYRKGWREALVELLSRPVVLVAHNFHFELAMLRAEGFDVSRVVWHDTMILSQIFDNLQPSYTLDYQAYTWGRYPMEADAAVAKAAKIYGTYDKIPVRLMDPYQRADVERAALPVVAQAQAVRVLRSAPVQARDDPVRQRGRRWLDHLREHDARAAHGVADAGGEHGVDQDIDLDAGVADDGRSRRFHVSPSSPRLLWTAILILAALLAYHSFRLCTAHHWASTQL